MNTIFYLKVDQRVKLTMKSTVVAQVRGKNSCCFTCTLWTFGFLNSMWKIITGRTYVCNLLRKSKKSGLNNILVYISLYSHLFRFFFISWVSLQDIQFRDLGSISYNHKQKFWSNCLIFSGNSRVLEEDMLILRVVEAYCTSARARHTLNSKCHVLTL